MPQNRSIAFFTIILFNLVPVAGVAFYNWLPFEMFWLFWMETLVLSFFTSVRILFSQGHTAGLNNENLVLRFNTGPALKYLLTRIGIFIFYSIFIITFIGFAAPKTDPVQVVRTLAFQNLLFNLALLLIICSNLFYLLRHFFMNGAYLFASRKDYAALFDGRQIVIHVAVVLGAVGATFLFKNDPQGYGAVWIISILCLAKCILELYLLKRSGEYR